MFTIRIYDQWRLHLGPNIEGSLANQRSFIMLLLLPIQTFTFHFPKTNSDPLSR